METELDQTADRARYTQAILDSDAQKRLIVAGPGTGKTYTFQEALERIEGDGLALTFINNLADELDEDLGGLAQARTFHGYCKFLLHSIPVEGLSNNFDYYPALFDIIGNDLTLLDADTNGNVDDFERVFQNLAEDEPLLESCLELGDYYDSVGHTDAVYRVFRHLRRNQEAIPSYELIVVDEYQDFTLLETEFIDLLTEASPILAAGDDDQALYGFRHASPEYIRAAAEDDSFETFELPYCSRCPQVVVQAFHDIVNSATDRGLLTQRIEKQFTCYLPDKGEVSERNPNLIHAACTVERSNAPYMGRYITTQINSISDPTVESSYESSHPTVLVIGPSPFLDSVYEVLANEFSQVELKKGDGFGLDPIDAYGRLLEDESSNVGWRILTLVRPFDGINSHVRAALESEEDLVSHLPGDYREHHLYICHLMREHDVEELTNDQQQTIEDALDESVDEAYRALGLTDIENGEVNGLNTNLPRIVCTSMAGAKGMSAAYVFLVGMVDGHFPRDPTEPTNTEVRKLLVGLTRTRVRCYLLSCGNYAGNWVDESSFLSWIDRDRIQRQAIDADTLAELESP